MIVPPNILLAVLFCSGAAFIYLRLVAKEVHRREQYLEKRLEDKIEEWKKKQESLLSDDEAETVAEEVPVLQAVDDIPQTEDPQPQAA